VTDDGSWIGVAKIETEGTATPEMVVDSMSGQDFLEGVEVLWIDEEAGEALVQFEMREPFILRAA